MTNLYNIVQAAQPRLQLARPINNVSAVARPINYVSAVARPIATPFSDIFNKKIQSASAVAQPAEPAQPAQPAEQAQPAQPAEQAQPAQQNLTNIYKDMFEREAKRADARQTQNLNAARLAAQQQAALAGYDPAMASRAMFERNADAYGANQDIENALAQYGLETEEKGYERTKDLARLAKEAGYDTLADSTFRGLATSQMGDGLDFTHYSQAEKDMQAFQKDMELYDSIINDSTGRYSDSDKEHARALRDAPMAELRQSKAATQEADRNIRTQNLQAIADGVYIGNDIEKYLELSDEDKRVVANLLVEGGKAIKVSDVTTFHQLPDGKFAVKDGKIYKVDYSTTKTGNKFMDDTITYVYGTELGKSSSEEIYSKEWWSGK